jgi:para-nitrobenzyl esterase
MKTARQLPPVLTLVIWLSSAFSAAQNPSTYPGSKRAPTSAVRINSGKVRGLVVGDTKDVDAFKGIPYAAPPVGGLRWKPPQPVKPWEGVRDCFEFGPACPQVTPMILAAIPELAVGAPLGEDCLYLNVWTPAGHEGKTLPVLYWIHGGGFVVGAASQPLYDGEELSRLGCVVVSVNYRVGLFGFLAHPALSNESSNHISGNYGLLDQIEGLRWVHRNIGAFGGDPDRVTIFGESAGGISVLAMMVAPQARGLFHGAIAQSATAMDFAPLRGEAPQGRLTAEESGRRFISSCGLGDSPDVAQMRKLDAKRLLSVAPSEAAGGPGAALHFKPLLLPIGPAIDGHVLLEEPRQAFAAGHQNPVPLIIGNTQNEMSLFMLTTRMPADEASYLNILKQDFGDFAEPIAKAYPGHDPVEIRASAIQLATDLSFVSTTRFFARAAARQKTFRYQFSRGTKKGFLQLLGAHHGVEVAFVFQRPFGTDQEEKSISHAMGRYWLNFAASGDPNGTDLPTWPSYRTGEEAAVDFAHGISVLKDLRIQQLDLIEKVLQSRDKD